MQGVQFVYTSIYNSPCGKLVLGALGDGLCLCNWLHGKNNKTVYDRLQRLLNVKFVECHTDVTTETARQLDEYFAGKRSVFDLPLLHTGTDFQKAVWNFLPVIRYGETMSYQALAEALDVPRAVRAVANAVGANALSIIVPCHRIVGSGGGLTGYAGGLNVKKYLLALEKTYLSQCSCSTLKNS